MAGANVIEQPIINNNERIEFFIKTPVNYVNNKTN